MTAPASDLERASQIIDEVLEWVRQAAGRKRFGCLTDGLEARASGALDLGLALRANKKAGVHPSWLDTNIVKALADARQSGKTEGEKEMQERLRERALECGYEHELEQLLG